MDHVPLRAGNRSRGKLARLAAGFLSCHPEFFPHEASLTPAIATATLAAPPGC